jgi:membrane-bound lytic murein transglycosylase A
MQVGGRRLCAVLALLFVQGCWSVATAQTREGPGGSRLSALPYADLPGWRADDHAAAFSAFLATCRVLVRGAAPQRPGLPASAPLKAVCAKALALRRPVTGDIARAFFEKQFQAWRIDPPGDAAGFLTGYYEPEIMGSRVKTPAFPIPALGRPDDLVSFRAGAAPAGLDPALQGARKLPSGGYEPYPDRAAIEDGALAGRGLEQIWLPDRVELFLAQVQGSARIKLPDGQTVRLAYAARNGHPYTSIGRVIATEGHMALEAMNLESMKTWLRANPQEARRIMRLNKSYIFFELKENPDIAQGPVGGASVPLAALRSIAVDRALWPYGLPFWIAAALPVRPGGEPEAFKRLLIAQDTGSAILGPARGDIFFGSGAAAGERAGLIRHPGTFVVLLPREEARL